MKPTLVIGVNIGNTSTDVALVDVSDLCCCDIVKCPTVEGSAPLMAAILRFAESLPAGCLVGIASVVSGRAEELVVLIAAALPDAQVSIISGLAALPITIAYTSPATLGADRIADALYARARFPGRTVICLDAGTAVTVDLLREDGVFVGGYIMPGAGLQLNSLVSGTANLPAMALGSVVDDVPASTGDAISEGVRTMYAGGINLAVSRLMESCAIEDAAVCATGGGFDIGAGWYFFSYEYAAEMTVIGAALGA